MFTQCKKCGYVQETKKVERNYYVCSNCNNNMPLNSYNRIRMVADEDSFSEINENMGFYNPIKFPGYEIKYNKARQATNLKEAIVTGYAKINGIRVMIGVMDSGFMMSSMGAVVGEKITLMFECARKDRLPVVIFAASGGARMQEGIISLMQMVKTSSSVKEFSNDGGLFVSVLTNPTMGGVSASFAFLGDIILAESMALIGFAGRRVIQQTIQETLPEDFQTAEYLLENGFIDAIVERKNLKNILYEILRLHNYDLKNKEEEKNE
ncbi:TPA: acetyl-CoA carboxylase carboxyltransferase subunit beta [Clostridioides difficile]|uniref:acetyl-CoA carboxylase, carboxyltransferase subunit beta n=1 Tax=Clostridioides difficile TaxID=1496 RepID=UPI00038CCDBA|nr:acetyl-CoA carboxylase, carboxyltransferase subunit beta [Clostridioides difficile]EGT4625341.1 acetyl-CoA carboxylase carboxyltransferase subunit beta [Clostridioides difficile]ELX4576132.1 acetyl-CoA carboxylase carboxyltransferase subunit beta [Clostridioides difficile]EQK76195.1 acetyl-CoA carboxylase, carboxyl transferase, beta subunit [Clostridioides difficile CD113]MBH6986762.1 acetyl-CoA carboxylase carboxyltransferase subunit beta [Clostridioides difficile]MBH7139351.1 acetyl-CoA c